MTAGETAGEGRQLDLSAADSHKEPKTKEELKVEALIGDVQECMCAQQSTRT